MSLISQITLKDFKEKCKLLNIKEYGKKDQIITRITKHYIDNNLGIFSLEDYVNERNHSSQNDTPPINSPSHSLPEESNSVEASSPSCSAYTQPSTVYDVMIEDEEGDENEEKDDLLSISIQFKSCRIGQKPKVGRKPKAKKGDALKRN